MKKPKLENLTTKYKNIIRKIYLEKDVCRSELLDPMQYSTSTLYRTIHEMAELGLVEFSTLDTPHKRGELISLIGSVGYVFSVHLTRTSFRSAFVDLNHKFYNDRTHRIEKETSMTDVVNILRKDFDDGALQHGIAKDDVLGISISSVGPIDYERGVLLQPVFFASMRDWKNVPIKQIFEDEFDLPVMIECNANACSVGIYYANYYKIFNSITYFTISEGIGSGLIVNSNLLPRHHVVQDGLAHMTIEVNGPRCNCGNYGCVEAYVGIPALMDSFKRKLKILRYTEYGDIDELTFDDFCEAVRNGEEPALSILENASLILARGIENYLRIVNIDAVVLGGVIIEKIPRFFEYTKEAIIRNNKTIQVLCGIDESTHILQGVAETYVLSLL
ncbi:MAG: ROK family protein [Sphaerochaeta sp.]|nr:ROK family protein [Sphaerochaeta sp.]